MIKQSECKNVLGIMSGTSLDGLDLALCEFIRKGKRIDYNIVAAETLPYTAEWQKTLANAHTLSGWELTWLDREYAKFTAEAVNSFIARHNLKVDLISSHGHTIFHRPDKGVTLQIGNGNVISALTGISVVSDFRTGDVALGGQGAPLVPIGDEMLFGDYDFCLNLGGFANISYNQDGKRIAYDICPVNIVINHLMQLIDQPLDRNGELGRTGQVLPFVLNKLNSLEYYQKQYPKSLGREWLASEFLPIINKVDAKIEDKLRTVYEHIAMQIALTVEGSPMGKGIFLSGGGAYNDFLHELISAKARHAIIIPEHLIIEFKEALIFALLGYLKINGEINCLSSVTGASLDSSSGAIS